MADISESITFDHVDGKVRRGNVAEQLRAERDWYRARLEMIAQHDWQQIGAKGHEYTLEALANLIETAKRGLR